mmetsp:Transcript_16391/g.34591  ORF Transcript_16391/g.34591 Transcript_16391/m.34591 type:complete len:227 (+) Transcript_16391:324-1004(+)
MFYQLHERGPTGILGRCPAAGKTLEDVATIAVCTLEGAAYCCCPAPGTTSRRSFFKLPMELEDVMKRDELSATSTPKGDFWPKLFSGRGLLTRWRGSFRKFPAASPSPYLGATHWVRPGSTLRPEAAPTALGAPVYGVASIARPSASASSYAAELDWFRTEATPQESPWYVRPDGLPKGRPVEPTSVGEDELGRPLLCKSFDSLSIFLPAAPSSCFGGPRALRAPS